ncbi:hypothetical protein XENTR_v10007328 [Xenopus tropicalis]|uniref:Olfactory receptor n=1 Tax=Xenopus tropicalis TaxID=8364 RepID=A0A1B8Y8U1_XENTR|nr:olfactory receptor 52D1 [Xenopus tropicalis]KAE8628113.1 hypothetical protein XENTR_v10007328 [Xenopus tropicalis]|eukprot:XP_002941607.1 PREDICTED: olfactory receptor 52D1-like [Xenopus tropicalis]
MINVTAAHPEFLTLGFGELTSIKYLYSLLVFLGFALTLLLNSLVVAAVALHRSLQEPVYMFICALSINGIYGSVVFYPGIFVTLLYQVQKISYGSCLAQVFFIHTYGSFELATLAGMAIDRYICICNPLRYTSLMSHSTVLKIIAVGWVNSIVAIGTNLVLTYRLPLCDSVILKIYCDNWSVVRLSCVDTTINNIFGNLVSTSVIYVPILIIVFSYVEILRVCVRSSKEVISKALQTCSPQLIISFNFVTGALFDIFLYRYMPTSVPYQIRLFMSLEFLVISPILNSFIYGLKMKEMRSRILKLLHLETSKVHEKHRRSLWYG